jgi:hypothetical protein
VKTLPIILLVVAPLTSTFALQPQSPDEIYGQLFRDVQQKKVFPDIVCHHPRMANIMGLPFYGVIYSEPLRTRTAL